MCVTLCVCVFFKCSRARTPKPTSCFETLHRLPMWSMGPGENKFLVVSGFESGMHLALHQSTWNLTFILGSWFGHVPFKGTNSIPNVRFRPLVTRGGVGPRGGGHSGGRRPPGPRAQQGARGEGSRASRELGQAMAEGRFPTRATWETRFVFTRKKEVTPQHKVCFFFLLFFSFFFLSSLFLFVCFVFGGGGLGVLKSDAEGFLRFLGLRQLGSRDGGFDPRPSKRRMEN